jgi:hypothetical protein
MALPTSAVRASWPVLVFGHAIGLDTWLGIGCALRVTINLRWILDALVGHESFVGEHAHMT